MFCSHCGEKVTSESAFCSNCGKKTESVKSTSPAKKKGYLQAAIIGVAVLVFIGALLGGYTLFFKPDSPERAVKQLIRAMEKGNVDEFVKLLPEETRKKINKATPDQRINFEMSFRDDISEDIRNKGGIKKILINNVGIMGNEASVKYTILFGNGNKDSGEASLRKENGKWKIKPGPLML